MRTPILLGASAVMCAAVLAGDLDPPPGPVAPTMKTLVEVEPRTVVNADNTPGDSGAKFVIKQPGSYYLDSNLIAEPAKDGIRIESSGVTLDLMGFELIGLTLEGPSNAGVRVLEEGVVNIVIRNGSVRSWGEAGIDALGATGSVVEDIVSGPNQGAGIVVGEHCRVRDCTAYQNGDDGIVVGRYGLVEGCLANRNVRNGFELANDCVALDCQASRNAADGFNGDQAVRIERCFAGENGSNGMDVNERSQVIGCTVDWNDMAGIGTDQSWCRFIGNTIMRHNVAGSSAIFISGSQCVVDGNTISQATTGVRISTGTDNFIVRNRFTSTPTPLSIPAGNQAAPVRANFVGVGPWDNFAN